MSADRVSLSIGFDPRSMLRQKAAVMHVLQEKIFNLGHTWCQLQDVVDEVMGLIGYQIEQGVINALVEEKPIEVDKRMFTTKEIYGAEVGSAARLWKMVVQYNNLKESDDI